MQIRGLLLASATLVILGASVATVAYAAGDDDGHTHAPAVYNMKNGEPPPLKPVEPKEQEEMNEERMKVISEQFKEIYGTEKGPFEEIEKQEAAMDASRKKVATYNMTFEQRLEMERKEAAEKAGGIITGQEEKPTTYIYNRVAPKSNTPPRLFNNVPQ